MCSWISGLRVPLCPQPFASSLVLLGLVVSCLGERRVRCSFLEAQVFLPCHPSGLLFYNVVILLPPPPLLKPFPPASLASQNGFGGSEGTVRRNGYNQISELCLNHLYLGTMRIWAWASFCSFSRTLAWSRLLWWACTQTSSWERQKHSFTLLNQGIRKQVNQDKYSQRESVTHAASYYAPKLYMNAYISQTHTWRFSGDRRFLVSLTEISRSSIAGTAPLTLTYDIDLYCYTC